ncbi:MAG: signal recognition particle protein [Bacilli bacterium]|nr:signal recognition particle protein [Bacilli bacterium]
MFEDLGDRLDKAMSKIKGYGSITEDNISDVVREVRLALLEADVNYKVVKEFTNKVKEKALGEEVKKSLKPDEVFLKILKDELLELLGTEKVEIETKYNPTLLMLVGLQGSGKTTTIGKLANLLRKKYNKKPLIVACDIYRPAAIEQLKTIGKSLGIEVFEEGKKNPVEIVNDAVDYAKENGYNYLLVDTAGRLQIDEDLMQELININESVKMHEILLVLDSMIGQDAINVITGFNEKLPLTGVILTKMDGDTRGGVAISARYLTNVPIKFVGTSEKLDGIEEFDSERMVGRILGMGDMMGLIEKAESVMNEEDAEESLKKMKKGKYDLEDFLKQFKTIKKLGSLEGLLKMIPGAKKMGLTNVQIDPKQVARIEAIVLSMTPSERKNPDIIKASRKERIAKGSGTSVQEVNKLLKQFEESKKMMKMMSNGNFKMPM